MGERRVSYPLKVTDALRGGRRLCSGIPLLSPEHDSLSADVSDVRDQDETDRGEQERPTDDVAILGGRLPSGDRRQRGSQQNHEQHEGAARRLHRARPHPHQHEELVRDNGLRQELQQQQLGDARAPQGQHQAEAHLPVANQPGGRTQIHHRPARRQEPSRQLAKPFVGREQGQQGQDQQPVERDEHSHGVPGAGQIRTRVRILTAHEELADHVPSKTCRERPCHRSQRRPQRCPSPRCRAAAGLPSRGTAFPIRVGSSPHTGPPRLTDSRERRSRDPGRARTSTPFLRRGEDAVASRFRCQPPG